MTGRSGPAHHPAEPRKIVHPFLHLPNHLSPIAPDKRRETAKRQRFEHHPNRLLSIGAEDKRTSVAGGSCADGLKTVPERREPEASKQGKEQNTEDDQDHNHHDYPFQAKQAKKATGSRPLTHTATSFFSNGTLLQHMSAYSHPYRQMTGICRIFYRIRAR
jgi:hypothetical protein